MEKPPEANHSAEVAADERDEALLELAPEALEHVAGGQNGAGSGPPN